MSFEEKIFDNWLNARIKDEVDAVKFYRAAGSKYQPEKWASELLNHSNDEERHAKMLYEMKIDKADKEAAALMKQLSELGPGNVIKLDANLISSKEEVFKHALVDESDAAIEYVRGANTFKAQLKTENVNKILGIALDEMHHFFDSPKIDDTIKIITDKDDLDSNDNIYRMKLLALVFAFHVLHDADLLSAEIKTKVKELALNFPRASLAESWLTIFEKKDASELQSENTVAIVTGRKVLNSQRGISFETPVAHFARSIVGSTEPITFYYLFGRIGQAEVITQKTKASFIMEHMITKKGTETNFYHISIKPHFGTHEETHAKEGDLITTIERIFKEHLDVTITIQKAKAIFSLTF